MCFTERWRTSDAPAQMVLPTPLAEAHTGWPFITVIARPAASGIRRRLVSSRVTYLPLAYELGLLRASGGRQRGHRLVPRLAREGLTRGQSAARRARLDVMARPPLDTEITVAFEGASLHFKASGPSFARRRRRRELPDVR